MTTTLDSAIQARSPSTETDFISRQFQQLSRKTSSVDFLGEIDKKLRLSDADKIFDKYMRAQEVLKGSYSGNPVKDSANSENSIVMSKIGTTPSPRLTDELDQRLRQLERGFTRLAELTTTETSPLNSTEPLRISGVIPAGVEDPLTNEFRKMKAAGV